MLLLDTQDKSTSLLLDKLILNIKEEYLDNSHSYPWIIGFSGGKDSTLVAHLVLEAVLDVSPTRRTRKIHIVSNDTLIESPIVIEHLQKLQSKIDSFSQNFKLPINVVTTKPDSDKTFWSLLIGKGYPSPNQTMRWCTDRLKIKPTSDFILKNVSKYGSAIILLGVRKDESNSRRNIIDKYKNKTNTNLSSHSSLAGAFVNRPIMNLTTDEVWSLLSYYDPPWGGTHEALIQLYKDADGGDCPVVLSKDDAPGCGTVSSRFGCWVCTVVEKDKSLQGFIDSGMQEYQCLIDFRDWLKSIRNDPEHRQLIRRNGKMTFDKSGKHIPGPFTIQTRKLILDRLLETQVKYGKTLISKEEIDIIQSHWANELILQEKCKGEVSWR